jgi:hypothetical protein
MATSQEGLNSMKLVVGMLITIPFKISYLTVLLGLRERTKTERIKEKKFYNF